MKLKKFALVVIGICLFATFFSFSPGDRVFEIAKNLDIFATLYQEVNTYYVDEVNPTELMNVGINAMLNTLDPYTNYIPEDRIEEYRTMTTGEYGGVGMTIGVKDGKIMVLMVNQGYAADKAGMAIGDELLQVDDIQISNRSIDQISTLLKGQANTNVELTIKRFGEEEPVVLGLTREKIHVNNVPYFGMVNDNTGLIQLTDFTRNASKEVRDALLDLKEQGADQIILDLRGNPGGLLNEAVNISNIFLPKGSDIVSTKGKITEWNRTYKALNTPVDLDIPLAVLINESSASASEIVSGVLQDYDRAAIVGQRSFGKGLVQTTRSLSYNSQLKVTIAKYYIPSGRCIQEIDYSHRDENGSPSKLPDSLRAVFKTQNGRPVYDGGGILPDIEIPSQDYAPITKALINRGLIFNYATKYFHAHPEIKPARDFQLTDSEFQEFANWLQGKDYSYKTRAEQSIERLVLVAQMERSYEKIESDIEILREKVYHNKDEDIQNFKDEVKEVLESEICKRYFFEKGVLESSFDEDMDIAKAVEILDDEAQYAKILKLD